MMSDAKQCPQGHDNPAAARFCVVCGAPFPAEVETEASTAHQQTESPPEASLGSLSNHESQGMPSQFAPEPKSKKKWILAGIGALVALVLVGAGVYLFTTSSVPDVIGESVSAATSTLEEAGFTVDERPGEFSDDVEKGLIVAQDPAPGGRAGSGGEVGLIPSRGPAVVVPDFVGDTFEVASREGRTLGITVEAREVVSETVPEGQVMDQEQAAGTEVEEESTVSLIVSAGPPVTSVTFTVDAGSFSTYRENDWNCDTFLTFFTLIYSTPIIQNEARDELATASGWDDDPSNGYFFPCKTSVTFQDVPTTEQEYRVVYDPDDPEDNRGPWISGTELEARGWEFSN